MAATHVSYGSDIDFGTLTRQLIAGLQQNNNFTLLTRHQVDTLRQARNGRWQVSIKDIKAAQTRKIDAGFVFLGAGGGALPLLQKSGISESKGYGGFPVSGQWLVCQNEAIIKQHNAKVYGKAPIGAPPMSVPHLDTRIIHGRPALLFGPYAGFTTKFLKQGSFLDLVASVKTNNLRSMLSAGLHNRDLTRYLVGEVLQSHTERMRALRHFYPEAKEHDWVLADAGQRVQIIKNGKLEFGTEIVTAADGTLAALLGASPGASTSVPAMLQVLGKCFPQQIATKSWADRLMELIPSYGQSLIEDAQLLKKVRSKTLKVLKLN
jgi:malate dehydrogenase (quinone)